MENLPDSTINCCSCDKDLSSESQVGPKTRITKYRCPGCERIYCCADCFKSHKEKFSCPGTRCKTPYVSLSKFDQKQFLDDYFFLEDVNSKIELSQKQLSKLSTSIRKNKSSNKKSWRSRKQKQKSNRV